MVLAQGVALQPREPRRGELTLPEYPDVVAYVERLRERVAGLPLQGVRLGSPFVLRSIEPPLAAAAGRRVEDVSRLGKRVVLCLEGDLFLVIHLMIAGRLRWRPRGAALPGKRGMAAFDFPSGTLLFTEEGTKKRARMHLVRGEEALSQHDPGGLEVMEASPEEFAARLRLRNHTLKRALTDPGLFSGIGNAYSDEILHAARLSPVKWTQRLTEEEVQRLYEAARSTLSEWSRRLLEESAGSFPEKVTAFRPEMAVHGRYGKPCPTCGSPVQRISYADNETNYCPPCQTEGKLLADRSLSRLLGKDWPRTLEELEEHVAARSSAGSRGSARPPRRGPPGR